MDAENIRKLRLADPFRPFNLIMNDGRKLPVDQPYYLGMSEDGALMIHASVDGGFEDFDPASVQRVDFEMKRNSKKRRVSNGLK